MNLRPNIFFAACASIAFGLTAAATAVSTLAAPPDQKGAGTPAVKVMESPMMKACQEMQDRREKMMAEMKAQDAALAAEVAKMNAAPADKKVDLLAALVTRMIQQQTAVHARMENMHEEMMEHMMRHAEGGQSTKGSPMMMEMKKSGDGSETMPATRGKK